MNWKNFPGGYGKIWKCRKYLVIWYIMVMLVNSGKLVFFGSMVKFGNAGKSW